MTAARTDAPVAAVAEAGEGADPLEADAAVRASVEELAASRSPFLIGVRHHSPALAASMPELLAGAAPSKLLVELPPELESWLPWLADPETQAPVALAVVRAADNELSFYPFADFSPELAAIRWAFRNGIPLVACDLPWSSPDWGRRNPSTDPELGAPEVDRVRKLYRAAGVDDGEELWDRLVEVRAPGSSTESIRRAALAVGWALRRATPRVSAADLAREAWMRKIVAEAGERTAAVIGAFHAGALLDGPLAVEPKHAPSPDAAVTSLIPYTFRLLDSRSGYPAGIRDPEWQQAAFGAALDPAAVRAQAIEFATRIAAEMRDAGHAAGTVEATEIARVANDLARLRGHAAPGRRELVEACAAALTQGDPLGRGRAVARAMDVALVGRRQGRLAEATPRSGLAPHVEQLLAELRLPGQGDPEADLRLDPLRSDLDRRRHVALTRLTTCAIAYAEHLEGIALGVETLTQRWIAAWQPATSALIELAGLRGVTLEQAATGAIRAALARAEDGGEVEPAARVVAIRAAGECGLASLTDELLRSLEGPFLERAGLAELVACLDELERIERGHVPGLQPPDAVDADLTKGLLRQLLSAAVRRLDGVAGSDRVEDARALSGLVRRVAADEDGGTARIDWALQRIARDGSPLMQGAAVAVLALTGRRDPAAYGAAVGSWLDAATEPATHRDLAARFRGTLVVAAPVLESATPVLEAISDRLEALPDSAFVARLPALRDGFDVLSQAGRLRFLQAVVALRGLSTTPDLRLEAPAEWLALWAAADEAGRAAVVAAGHRFEADAEAEAPTASSSDAESRAADADPDPRPREPARAPNRISLVDRWRLILGQEPDLLEDEGRRLSAALDELYGAHGEGSRAGLGGGRGDDGYPSVRDWDRELEALFGDRVREELLGRAVERGNTAAVDSLNPETVTPSVELLEQVLTLAGAVPEASVGRLRKLVGTVVDALVRELAITVRPAISGTVTPRTTRRRGGRLHLARTVRANLGNTRPDEAGRLQVVPERPYFHVKGRRAFEWRVVLCVDVSGSMEASTIYAALMAAIINGLPSVTTSFVAFSDRVVDLSDRVDDPLALLLEIRIGGGTDIAGALRYARTLVTVPSRTVVIVVSDFEEGFSVPALLAEVRTLAAGGSRLLGLAALDDAGAARYDAAIAGDLVAAGMPVAALTPLELAGWVGEQIRGG
jgi:Family of unknown function (DUF5682)/VWA domain containing CoxE-like protein